MMMTKLSELSKMAPALILISAIVGIPSYMAVNAHSQDERAHPSLQSANQVTNSKLKVLSQAIEHSSETMVLVQENNTKEHERMFAHLVIIVAKLDKLNER